MRLTKKGHACLEASLGKGDLAIDGTAGNGHDTLKMATLVGKEGQVIAVDLQEAAIEATRRRLMAEGQETQVRLICGDHADVLAGLDASHEGRVGAIVFNLGYLPGSDKSVTTQAAATVAALQSSLRLLKAGAPLLVTAYRGHEGGQGESEEVERWARSLEASEWSVSCDEPSVRPGGPKPPVLWTIRPREARPGP